MSKNIGTRTGRAMGTNICMVRRSRLMMMMVMTEMETMRGDVSRTGNGNVGCETGTETGKR